MEIDSLPSAEEQATAINYNPHTSSGEDSASSSDEESKETPIDGGTITKKWSKFVQKTGPPTAEERKELLSEIYRELTLDEVAKLILETPNDPRFAILQLRFNLSKFRRNCGSKFERNEERRKSKKDESLKDLLVERILNYFLNTVQEIKDLKSDDEKLLLSYCLVSKRKEMVDANFNEDMYAYPEGLKKLSLEDQKEFCNNLPKLSQTKQKHKHILEIIHYINRNNEVSLAQNIPFMYGKLSPEEIDSMCFFYFHSKSQYEEQYKKLESFRIVLTYHLNICFIGLKRIYEDLLANPILFMGDDVIDMDSNRYLFERPTCAEILKELPLKATYKDLHNSIYYIQLPKSIDAFREVVQSYKDKMIELGNVTNVDMRRVSYVLFPDNRPEKKIVWEFFCKRFDLFLVAKYGEKLSNAEHFYLSHFFSKFESLILETKCLSKVQTINKMRGISPLIYETAALDENAELLPETKEEGVVLIKGIQTEIKALPPAKINKIIGTMPKWQCLMLEFVCDDLLGFLEYGDPQEKLTTEFRAEIGPQIKAVVEFHFSVIDEGKTSLSQTPAHEKEWNQFVWKGKDDASTSIWKEPPSDTQRVKPSSYVKPRKFTE